MNEILEEAKNAEHPFGIHRSTVGPLIALVSTCIGALTAVLIILSRDKRQSD